MTILSDKEIIERCTQPKFVIYGQRAFSKGMQFMMKEFSEFSHLDEEEIKKYVDACNYSTSGLASIVPSSEQIKYRPVTKEDLKTWKPMITPFTPGQVRYSGSKRPLTPEEMDLVNRSHHLMPQYDPNLVLPEYIQCTDAEEGFMAREKIVSYGTSSYGYDLRCGHKFKVFTNVNTAIVDPKNFDPKSFVDVEVENDGDFVIVPPNSFVLTYALEWLNMPKNVTGIVIGKSTYARTGLNCICTPAEAGWEGHLTLEFANTTPLPVKLYAGEGCCQICFFEGRVDPLVSYADRAGKYMGQKAEVTLPKT